MPGLVGGATPGVGCVVVVVGLLGLATDTIARLERGEALKPATVAAIQTALEAAGVIFVAENGEGPGVRLRKLPPG